MPYHPGCPTDGGRRAARWSGPVTACKLPDKMPPATVGEREREREEKKANKVERASRKKRDKGDVDAFVAEAAAAAEAEEEDGPRKSLLLLLLLLLLRVFLCMCALIDKSLRRLQLLLILLPSHRKAAACTDDVNDVMHVEGATKSAFKPAGGVRNAHAL